MLTPQLQTMNKRYLAKPVEIVRQKEACYSA